MAAAKRSKPSTSYAESNGPAPSAPPTLEKSCVAVDTVEESEDELIKYVQRKSSGRHSLRPRSALTLSLKAAENGDRKPNNAADVSLSMLLDDTITFTSEC